MAGRKRLIRGICMLKGSMKMKLLSGRMGKLFRFSIYAIVLLGVVGCMPVRRIRMRRSNRNPLTY